MTQAYVIKTENGNFDSALELAKPPTSTNPAQQDDILTAVKRKRVLLHIHGGLVPFDAALAGAHRLSRTVTGDGASYDPEDADVQLYLIWQADITTTLKNLLNNSIFGTVIDAIRKWNDNHGPVPGAKDGVRGAKDGDTADFDEGKAQLLYETELGALDAQLQQDDPFLNTPPPEEGQRRFSGAALIKIAMEATWAIYNRRNTNPEDYYFEAMVREEVLKASGLGLIGQQIWAQMKTTAVQHATGGFQTFLQQVYKNCTELTLVGHSTGANIITALLPTLESPAPNPKKLKVVFLAPAVRIDAFTTPESIAAFTAHLLHPLRIYAMASKVEFDDKIEWEKVVFYPGSLLQLVNFVFETPNPGHVLGMAHYAEKQKFGDFAVTLITQHDCTSHGGFDDARDILKQALKFDSKEL